MDRGARSNVVDGPFLWRAPSADPWETKESGAFWPCEALWVSLREAVFDRVENVGVRVTP